VTTTASTNQTSLPARDAVPIEHRWDLESVFATAADWEAAFTAAERRVPELGQFRGRLAESAATLLAALRLRDDLGEAVDRVAVYATLRRSEDATNSAAAAMADRSQGLDTRLQAEAAFLHPEIAALPPEQIASWLERESGLAPYKHAIERIQRRRVHIRSAEVEEVIALAGDVGAVPETIRDVLEDGDMPFAPIEDENGQQIELAQGNLQRYLRSPARRVRRAAWEHSADAYLAFQNTYATTLGGGIKYDAFRAKSHGYETSLEATLDIDAIPTEVFHNLVATVWRNLPTWHRYFRARRRLLGLAQGDLHGYDLTAPLTTADPVIAWEDGVAMILESLAPLGEDYVRTMRQGIADRWVDRAPNIGKGGGAFSWGSFGTYPFISMTYKDDLPSVSTLTHELGHSMHTYLTSESQPPTYFWYSMFAAETASNLHQALLGTDLLAMNQDRDWTLAVIDERMGNHMRYLFTMPILAKFELDCHTKVMRGEALTAEAMNETLLGFFREAYGGEVVLDDARMGITWASFGHLFTGFYVFQYATGIAAAAALAAKIRDEGEPARARYLEFLRAGDARYPIDALLDAGVDMRSPEPVQRAFDILAGYVDRLEELADATG